MKKYKLRILCNNSQGYYDDDVTAHSCKWTPTSVIFYTEHLEMVAIYPVDKTIIYKIENKK